MLLVVAISIVLVLLTAYFINTFQIGNNPNPTKHHAIRNHKHGGNHGSPAQSDRSIYPHNQPRRTEALGEQLFPRLRMTCGGRSSLPLSLKTPGPHSITRRHTMALNLSSATARRKAYGSRPEPA